jgi:methionyl-tRNA synthetase
MAKFYITTAIDYVNGDPHIGHAAEKVQADVLARWHRLIGDDVYFLTGSDENTIKIVKIAEQEGITPQAVAEKYSAKFIAMGEALSLSADQFIRTSDETVHHPGATKLWEAFAQNDLIYKGTYEGWYCPECEQFYTEKEFVDGKCPEHGIPLERWSEENYLFKLSAFTDRIKELIESDSLQLTPPSRRNEILAFLDGGLEDISFSRPASKLKMGVPVPGDDSQRMYVWCDALANYITGIGYGRDEAEFAQWWPADLHLIGKGITRFHAVIWPAMLLGAGIELPKAIYAHGYLTLEGKKISKSKGNVVDPVELVKQHGADPIRYYLLRSLPYDGDGDYSERHFQEIHAAELANDFGNLASRILTQIVKGYEGAVPAGVADPDLKEHIGQTHHQYGQLLEDYKFSEALERLNGLVSLTNKRIELKKPWELEGAAKENELYNLAQVLGHLALLYQPILPEKAGELLNRLNLTPEGWNRKSLLEWEKLPAGTQVQTGPPLFPK